MPPEETELPKTRPKRQKSRPIIVLSDDSDEETFTTINPRTPKKEKSRIPDVDLHELSPVTPPKQKRVVKNIINNENLPQTPSSLLKNLTLTSPTFKNNWKQSAEKDKANRRSLFPENEEPSVYQSARKALHSTFPTKMPGREKEHEELRDFITTHLRDKTSGSLYVSGPPGTGKTASLNLILEEDNVGISF